MNLTHAKEYSVGASIGFLLNVPMMLGDISVRTGGDSGLVQSLIYVLLIGICVALVWWVGKWFIGQLGAPAIAMTIWNGLFILIGLIVIVNFLLGLTGHPLVRW